MNQEEKQKYIDQINTALDDIRPHLAVDGGDVEVVDISDEWDVSIKWIGNCASCEMSTMTLRAGVEHTLKRGFPQIKSVIPVNGISAA